MNRLLLGVLGLIGVGILQWLLFELKGVLVNMVYQVL